MQTQVIVAIWLFVSMTINAAANTIWSPAPRIVDRTIYSKISRCNDRLVAVGAAGRIATTLDGYNWTLRYADSGGNALYNVGPGPSGTCIAVGANGTLLVSYDTITWTNISSNSPTIQYIYSLATDGGSLMLGAANGYYVSSDLQNDFQAWQSLDSTNSPVVSLTYSSVAGEFLGTTHAGEVTNYYYTASWVNGTGTSYIPPAPSSFGAAYKVLSSQGSAARALYLGADPTNSSFFDMNWIRTGSGTPHSSTTFRKFDAIEFNNNLDSAVIVGMTSDFNYGMVEKLNVGNAVTLTTGPLSGVAANAFSTVAVGPGFDAPAPNNVGSGVIARSSDDGDTWSVDTVTPRSSLFSKSKPGALVDAGNRMTPGPRVFYVPGAHGTILRSLNGIDWSWQTTATDDGLNAVIDGTRPGLPNWHMLVAVGSNGNHPSVLSNNGIDDWMRFTDFSSIQISNNSEFLAIAFNPLSDTFVTVGNVYDNFGTPTIAMIAKGTGVSSNMEQWQLSPNLFILPLVDVAYLSIQGAGGNFCAVGNHGTLIRINGSGDMPLAINSGTIIDLKAVSTFFNASNSRNRAVVTGAGGLIRLIDDTCNIVNQTITLPQGVTSNLNHVSCNADSTKCVAVGENGIILSSTAASNMTVWNLDASNTTNYFNGVACQNTNSGICIAVSGATDGSYIQQTDHIFSSSMERFEFNQ